MVFNSSSCYYILSKGVNCQDIKRFWLIRLSESVFFACMGVAVTLNRCSAV